MWTAEYIRVILSWKVINWHEKLQDYLLFVALAALLCVVCLKTNATRSGIARYTMQMATKMRGMAVFAASFCLEDRWLNSTEEIMKQCWRCWSPPFFCDTTKQGRRGAWVLGLISFVIRGWNEPCHCHWRSFDERIQSVMNGIHCFLWRRSCGKGVASSGMWHWRRAPIVFIMKRCNLHRKRGSNNEGPTRGRSMNATLVVFRERRPSRYSSGGLSLALPRFCICVASWNRMRAIRRYLDQINQ